MRIFKSLFLAAGFLTLGGIQGVAATHNVEIYLSQFNPTPLTINVGDTVIWTQSDPGVHTVTSDTPELFDSGVLEEGATYSRVFNTEGTFDYHCDFHFGMNGSIIVQPAGPPPPTVSITSPANNTIFPAPTNVTIEASASASGGSITNVEFFTGTTSLGSMTAAPYQLTTSFPVGTHSLTARAKASNGGEATSSVITIFVQGAGQQITNAFAARIAKSDVTIELQPIASGMTSPLGAATPDDESGRMFVYDQVGYIHVIQNGVKLPTPMLDVRSRLVTFNNYDERGLLGAATHPNFAANPYIYTYTSETNGPTADFPAAARNHQSVITEWRISAGNSNVVDMATRREILRIDQPQANHNGGAMRFGPDGYLYVSLGDGGNADDQGTGHSTGGNGQDKSNILGDIIRINVDGRTSSNGQYSIPSNNPFVGVDGLDEIYASGFRNPYTFSFDRRTGELYVADVGQNHVEELNRVFKGGNYGWPIKEAGFFFNQNGGGNGFITSAPLSVVPHDVVDPIAQYDHDDGLAIVGGYVYRGSKIPGLFGRFVGGDWGSFATPTGRLYFLDRSEFREFRIGLNNRSLGYWLKGFGEDSEGELYIFGSTTLGPSGTTGVMLKIVPAPRDVICGVTRTGNQLNTTWENGVGPFVAQTKTVLDDPFWENVLATNGTATAFSTTAAAQQFVRISDLSGNAPIPFTAYLTGDAQRPNPVSTTGNGHAILSLEGNTLHFNVVYSNLSSAASSAQIRGPALVSGFADELIDLSSYNGGRWGTSGVLFGSVSLTAAQKAALLDGRTYLNVGSVNFTNGEIRGQIAPVVFTCDLKGSSEIPAVQTTGKGSGILFLTGNQLSLHFSYRDLVANATMAHIHGPASKTESAGILVDLSAMHNGSFGSRGSFAGVATLTQQQIGYLLEGRLYINVHSTTHGGGEIRGQLVPRSTAIPLTAPMAGDAERPTPVVSSGTGGGNLFLEGNQLHFQLGYSGLSTTAIAAHIHGFSDTAGFSGIQVDLEPFNNGAFGQRGAFAGQVTLSDVQVSQLSQAKTYVNVHSTQHTGGEIRGQVTPSLLQAPLSGAAVRPVAALNDVSGSARFLLVDKRLHVNATAGKLLSTSMTATIAGPATTENTNSAIVSLGAFPTTGGIATSTLLNSVGYAAVVDGLSYLQLATTNRPHGEMRGQILP